VFASAHALFGGLGFENEDAGDRYGLSGGEAIQDFNVSLRTSADTQNASLVPVLADPNECDEGIAIALYG
jgi:hypothetical protein